jgi:16S rRNA (adenine1518-N6/adenine1519-N6)-dimethyltransferase
MAEGKRVKPAKQDAVPNSTATAVGGAVSPARKSLGQNFLVDRSAATRIVEALGDISQKTVLEIGPGRGALTASLVARARHVIAIELDRVLAAQLRMKYANTPNIEIIEADILDIDFGSLLGPRPGRSVTGLAQPEIEKVRVVGNIPYYITSDILLALFAAHRNIECLVLMVQLEVAERLAAHPGGSEYGLLSATAQLYGSVEKLFKLPPGAFAPPPRVQSAVVRIMIAPRFAELGVDESGFIQFLRLIFGQKRKTLFNNLRERYEGEAAKAAMAAAKVRSDIRAEALSLEKMSQIYLALKEASKTETPRHSVK